MTQELQFDLENNAKEWRALSLSISSAERASFGNLHDRFFTRYGPNFMAHVYRTAMEEVLPSLPDAARSQLLDAFQQAMDEAIQKQAYALPTLSDCASCHSHKF
ncbi:hypothetical protein BEN47_12230 [Hymenobacter lapidarius]|uniref:Uncharacterized protein n=2 Tax=Hymenobacter lapidarius TaxID=1908237 RepID=A0A1G1T7A9_9BACT|nr:hypothetical protein BEN47_12230 [Hymenobacter lapidarius]